MKYISENMSTYLILFVSQYIDETYLTGKTNILGKCHHDNILTLHQNQHESSSRPNASIIVQFQDNLLVLYYIGYLNLMKLIKGKRNRVWEIN
jgi:hypothetical protein